LLRLGYEKHSQTAFSTPDSSPRETPFDIIRFVTGREVVEVYATGGTGFGAVAAALGKHHYDGWWVLEQDTTLTEEPAGEGPVADVRRSVEHLCGLS
jgi:sugar phosphate isomerase/epimerase